MAGSIEQEHESERKIVKEIPVVQDHGYFIHDTGDTYDGFFEAKKKDKNVKMHGPGVYTTAEGDIYSGTWEVDRLGANAEVTITYTDGAIYEGTLKDWCYSSHGKYTYPDESTLLCDFADNAPIGSLKLIDPNGHIWLGKAEQGYGWLGPVNHFYDMLEKTRDLRKQTKSRDIKDAEKVSKILQ